MVKQGKIIVLDGLDGCGKSTQFAALGKLLTEQGETVKPISFPMYDKPSAALVKMYLRGDFSDTPDGVNAYAASSLTALFRHWVCWASCNAALRSSPVRASTMLRAALSASTRGWLGS